MNCPICGNCCNSFECNLNSFDIVVCENCNLRFAPDSFGLLLNYDEIWNSEEYVIAQVNDLIRTADKSAFANHHTYRPFFKESNLMRHQRLLDVGCGVGRFLHAATASGLDVAGIDVSTIAITNAGKYGDFKLFCETIDDHLVRDIRYDFVTSFDVSGHIENLWNISEKCDD
jgi:2-polyprenyl-3-methyl-5-hydroxy-6-metoxy-1,4-benzoquinol methylase